MTKSPSTRALIMLGGEFPPASWAASLYCPSDIVIAADSGALLAECAHLPIDVLLGDFDSLPTDCTLTHSRPRKIRKFSTDKDYSDGELALLCAHEHHCSEAIFLGAMGGRLDHCLFNIISLLEKADNLGLKATASSPSCSLFQLSAGQERSLKEYAGYTCSAISLDSSSTLSMQGLLYSLEDLTIQRSSTRSLSNVVTDADNARIKVSSGRVLVILSSTALDED